MHRKLQEIAEVMAGYPFRTAIIPDKNGNILVLQPKDIDLGGVFTDTQNLTKVSLDISKNDFYLRYGDILIVSRGMKAGSFRATVFECKDENVVASSSLHIIRLKDKIVLPEYLCIYLNSAEGQNNISQLISGSYIGALPRSGLADMKVPIPSENTQKSIVDLHHNIKQQDKILERKKKLKQNIINATFTNLINK